MCIHVEAYLGASRQEVEAQDRGGVALKGFEASAVSQSPQPEGLVARSGGPRLVHRGELGGPDTPLVTPQGGNQHQVRQPPYLQAPSTITWLDLSDGSFHVATSMHVHNLTPFLCNGLMHQMHLLFPQR